MADAGLSIHLCPRCEKVVMQGTHCPACEGQLSLVDETFFLGKTLGKYRLESVLGVGGMGIVFRGVHLTLDMPVAVKFLIPEMADEHFIKRFQKEARLLATLKHPHIVEIYDLDISPWGPPYFVMEYLKGKSLRSFLGEYPNGIPYPLFQTIFLQLISALSFAHGKGVVHRDLKPENIFVTGTGDEIHVKILDFGIAKMVGEKGGSTQLTQTGAVLGTPYYMAPEQLTNQNIGPHTDQYALALMGIEMLMGRNPRENKTLGEIIGNDFQRPVEEVTFPPTVPPDVQLALLRATEPHPEDRLPSLDMFREVLAGKEGALTTPGVSLPRKEVALTTPISSSVKGKEKKKIPKYLALAFLPLILVAFYFLLPSKRPEAKEKRFSLQPLSAVPLDTGRILGRAGELIILQGSQNLYALDPHTSRPPTPLAMDQEEKVIQMLADESVLMTSPKEIFKRVLVKELTLAPEDKVLLSPRPQGNVVAADPEGKYFALIDGDTLQVWEMAGRKLVELPILHPQRLYVCMKKNRLALLDGEMLSLHSLPMGKKEWETTFPDGTKRVNVFQFLDPLPYIGVGGWFDSVYLYSIEKAGEKEVFSHPRQTLAMLTLPDGTLIISKEQALIFWNPIRNLQEIKPVEGQNFKSLAYAPRGIAAVEDTKQELYLAMYRGFPIQERKKISPRELWSMAIPPQGNPVYVGSADGGVYVYDRENGTLTPYKLHTQGVTAMVLAGNYLATASDDTTIALWRLPDMKVEWRKDLHKYLINFLYYQEKDKTLWSSSSDGTIKKLSLPNLSPLDEVKVGESCAAFYVNPEETILLVGTWDHHLFCFQKEGGRWMKYATYTVISEGLYCSVEVPQPEVALFVGVYPTQVYAYHLPTRKLYRLDSFGSRASWAVLKGKNRVLFPLNNGIVEYTLKTKQDSLYYVSRLATNTDLGVPLIVALAKGETLLAGVGLGELISIHLPEVVFTRFPEKKAERVLPQVTP